MVKVLIAITSASPVFYPDGKRTGLFSIEALQPFEVYRKKGNEVQFASETGSFEYDEISTGEDFLNGEDRVVFDNPNSEYNLALKSIKKAEDLDPNDYDIFYASAGHGVLFDYPNAKNLKKIASAVYAKGGVVCTVCRGGVLFKDLKDSKTNEPLIKGKRVTGFSEGADQMLGLTEMMKRDGLLTVNQVAQQEGATYVEPTGPWDNFTVTDERIVTGANPASSIETAEKSITAFNA